MRFAILSLISNTFVTSLACIGLATVVNKVGKFFKIIDEHKNDGFKAGFDTIMIDSIDELNRCVESITIISGNIGKICIIMYDISVGNKFIKKDKSGKIIICNKAKLYSGYKDKIDELKNKVKKYESELKKIKVVKKDGTTTDKNVENTEDDSEDDSSSSDSEKSYSDVSSDDEIIVEKDDIPEIKENEEEEFYLEEE
jgi:hypothetical protein